MGIQRRRDGGGESDSGGQLCLDSDLALACPNLVEFLTRDVWEDGSRRTRGTVLLLCEDRLWKAWLNDKDARMSAWVSGSSLQQLWERLDAILGGAAHEWRRDKEGGGKRK